MYPFNNLSNENICLIIALFHISHNEMFIIELVRAYTN